MPLKDRYLHAKDSMRRRFVRSPTNENSNLLPNDRPLTRSPSPASRTAASSATLVPEPQIPTVSDYASVERDVPPQVSATLAPIGLQAVSIIAPGDIPSATAPSLAPHTSSPLDPSTANQGLPAAAAWPGLKSILKVLGSRVDEFPPLQSAIGTLKECVEIFEASGLLSGSASKGNEDYAELRTKINSLLADLSQYLKNSESLEMTASMNNLCMGLNEELKVLQERFTKGTVRRLAGVMDSTEAMIACYRRIQNYLERLILNANLDMWETVNEIATEARLRKLSPTLSALYNSAESEDIRRRACTSGTREGELTRLLRWAHNVDPNAEDVYWMNGMAGTGKTTIAYSLCVELERTAALGASFFCSKLIPECRNVKLIIPSIAYQLARFSHPFRSTLSTILKSSPDIHTLVLQAQFDNLLLKPLSKVKHTLPTDFVIVIDALDECENEDSIGRILDLLLSHTQGDLPARFLISSRPESEIYRRMMDRLGNSLDSRLVLHDLDAQVVKKDIATYLEDELTSVGLSPSQLAQLVELSGVLFIFAATTARYIKDGLKDMQHEERLQMILGLSSDPLESKDRGVDKLYASILQNVFENANVAKSIRALLKSVLDLIICAQEPMNVHGIAGLLGLQSGKHVEAPLRRLSSVLNITESDGLVTTLHTSFPDYMLDRERSSIFYCDSATTHARVSQLCFEAIKSFEPQFNICRLESSYIYDDEMLALGHYTDRTIPPQLFYACRYWISHLEFGDVTVTTSDLLWDFLTRRLLLWMEVLNLKKCMNLGPGIAQRAMNWIINNSCPEEMMQLAHDSWRFITRYAGHVVARSTPHIYISMLLFWPESAPITKHYNTSQRGTINVCGAALEKRRLALLSTWEFDASTHSACFSPDGALIAFGTSSSILMIDSITGTNILHPLKHDGNVRSVAFSPDGKLIVSGSEDWTVRVWSAERGELVMGPLRGHYSVVVSALFFPDGTRIASGGGDGTIRVWDMKSGETTVGPIRAHSEPVRTISISPDGKSIASGSEDATVSIWSAETGVLVLGPLRGHTKLVNSVCFSPDGSRIASSSHDLTIRIWNAVSGIKPIHTLEGHTDQLTCVSFSSNGQQVVSSSRDATIRLWDANNVTTPAQVFYGHMDNVLSVAFSPDNTRIVSGSHDHTVRVWDARSRVPAESLFEGHDNFISSIAFSPDSSRILSSSDDSNICIWDAQTGKLDAGPLRGHTGWVNFACFSPDGSRIASCSNDKTVRLWDVQSTGSSVDKPLTGHTGAVRSVCFSPDGSLLVSGAEDRTVRLWSVESGEQIGSPLNGHKAMVLSTCFSSDGLRIVSGSTDRMVLVWDVQNTRLATLPLIGHTHDIHSVCVSPNNAYIASASEDKTIRLWDSRNGRGVRDPLRGHYNGVSSVSFSHDSRYIVSGSVDQSIRLWDVETGQAIGSPILGHTEAVRCACFSPDGMSVLSCSNDMTIRVWDVASRVLAQDPQDATSKTLLLIDDNSAQLDPWVLRLDGWVVDTKSHLLVWVPRELQPALMSPGNTLLISPWGSFRLEFGDSKLGQLWTE